jgi:hypothetical protein
MATRTQNRTRIRIRFSALKPLKPKESKNDISPHLHYSRLYLILQTTRHSRTPMLQALFIFWANVLVGKCLSGQMSFWANVFLGRCPSGQMSFWANVFLGKRPSGQTSSGQMSFWANAFLGKRRLGKRLMGKCPSGQMSSGQMSFCANVSGQMSLGKCLWANVVWANVGSPNNICTSC